MEPHPVRLHARDDLKRNRWTVFFRPILAIPLVIWLYAWGIVAALAGIVAWFAALFTARVPLGIHNFLVSFHRFSTHVLAYLTIEANEYPGFLGEPGYPVDLEIDPPVVQNRWTVFFRVVLALPAALIAGALGYVLYAVGAFNWVTGVILGRTFPGLVRLGHFVLRLNAQSSAYISLLTPRYPDFSPGGPTERGEA